VFEQNAMPPKNVTTTRTVQITNPCKGELFLCPGFPRLNPRECGDVSCETRSTLSRQVVVADVTPPVLTTLTPAIVTVPYQDKIFAYKYTLCPRFGDLDCGMSAQDTTDGDVSASLTVAQIKVNDTDLSCSTAAVTEGQCATGTYVYEYTASDKSGNEITKRLEVRIVSTGSVTTTYPFGNFSDPDGVSKANASGMVLATTGSPQNLVIRRSIAALLSDAMSDAYTEDSVEVIGHAPSPGFQGEVVTYATLVQVKIKVVTAGASASPATGGRRRVLMMARSTDDDLDSMLEEREVGWSADSDFSSAFLGNWRQRSLLQASASSSALSIALNAVANALTGSATRLSSQLLLNAQAGGITVDMPKDPEPPQTTSTTPDVDIAAVTIAALAAELEVMQLRVIRMEAAVTSVTSALPEAQGDPTGFKQVLEKAWTNGMEMGIKGHTDLLNIAIEAIAVLDATIKVQAQVTDAVLILQEQFLDTRNGLIAQLGLLSQALGFNQAGQRCDQVLTCFLCSKRDNGEIRIEFNASAGNESFKYFASPPPPPSPPPCSNQTALGGCADVLAQQNAGSRKLLQAGSSTTDGNPNIRVSDIRLEQLTHQFRGYDITLGASTQFAEDTGLVPDRMIRGENRIMAGILIYQKRSKLSYECSKRFSHLKVLCRTQESSTEAFGVDPVFKRGAEIYNLNLRDSVDSFYDVSNMNSSLPKGFRQRQADIEKGLNRFPVFFDILSRQSQAYRMLSYMIEGSFIDAATEELEVNIVSYNPDLRRFISHKVLFEHTKGGIVKTSSEVQVLNMGLYEGTSGILTFLLEMAVIAWILYTAYGDLHSFVSLLNFPQRKDFALLKALNVSFVQDNRAALLELVSTSLQIAAFIVWWFYQLAYAFKFSPAKRYEVYHAAAQPTGNFLLPAKNNTLNAFKVGGLDENSTYTVPRKPYMPWQLPEDTTGYHGLTEIVDEIDTMSHLMVTYGFLQGINLLLLLVRMMKMLKFQPRLAIVTNTLVGASLDLAHLGVIFGVFTVMTAVAAHIQYGARLEVFSTVVKSLIELFVMVLGESTGGDILQEGYELTVVEKLSAAIFYTFIPVFFILLLLNFLLGVLGDAFGEEKEFINKYQGDDLPTDLMKFVRYYSHRMHLRRSKIWPSHWTLRRVVRKAIDVSSYNSLSDRNKAAMDRAKSFGKKSFQKQLEVQRKADAEKIVARHSSTKAHPFSIKELGLQTSIKAPGPEDHASLETLVRIEQGFGDPGGDNLDTGLAIDGGESDSGSDFGSVLSADSSTEEAEQVMIINGERVTREQLIMSLNRIQAEYVSSVQESGSRATKRRAVLGNPIEQLVDRLVEFEHDDELDESSPEVIRYLRERAAVVRSNSIDALQDQIEEYRGSQEGAMAFNCEALGWMQQADVRLTQLEDNLTLLCEVMEKDSETIYGMYRRFGRKGLSDEQRERLLDAFRRGRAQRLAMEEQKAMDDMRSRLALESAAREADGVKPKGWGAVRVGHALARAAVPVKVTMADVVQRLKDEGAYGWIQQPKLNQRGVASMLRRRRVERNKVKEQLIGVIAAAKKDMKFTSKNDTKK
jgi:hypothetical protein